MRKDACKLITEHARHGGRGGNVKTRLCLDPRQDWEEADFGPSHISCSANRPGYEPKSFGDRLRPLYRFLKKSVGRNWNDVYSEICSVADGRSMDGNHMRVHVRQYVESRYPHRWYYSEYFYVDADGILCFETRKSSPKKEKPLEHIVWDALTTYDKKKGLWYRSEYKYADPNKSVLHYSDGTYSYVKASELPKWNPNNTELVKTRQVSKKEITKVLDKIGQF